MTDSQLDTLFLDAGGVLVHPNWQRVSQTLAGSGVHVAAAALAVADHHAKREMDDPDLVRSTTDESRALQYFNLVLIACPIMSEQCSSKHPWWGANSGIAWWLIFKIRGIPMEILNSSHPLLHLYETES